MEEQVIYFSSVVKYERGASPCPRLMNLGKAENIERCINVFVSITKLFGITEAVTDSFL